MAAKSSVSFIGINDAAVQRAIRALISALAQQQGAVDSALALEARVKSGGGTPEGVVVAPVGTLYLRSDGGAGTTFYVKESGTGKIGWVAK